MTGPADSEFEIVRCNPANDLGAFDLAARAWPATEQAAYRQALVQLILSDRSERIVLLSARRRERLLAAQLAQMLAGRAALVWSPQFAEKGNSKTQLAAEMGGKLAATLEEGGMHVAQALLAPDDRDGGELMTASGFWPAAELLYLSAETSLAPAAAPELPFELQKFDENALHRLTEVIQRTYVGTLDCPQIDGLRETADVIAGYQTVGDFRPDLWFLARDQGRDAGCLLMNLHPDVHHAEIVYLAVTPEVRGRGWGLALARYALWLARAAQAERVVLAVDSANMPATQLYSVAGFQPFDRRSIWLKDFHSKA